MLKIRRMIFNFDGLFVNVLYCYLIEMFLLFLLFFFTCKALSLLEGRLAYFKQTVLICWLALLYTFYKICTMFHCCDFIPLQCMS